VRESGILNITVMKTTIGLVCAMIAFIAISGIFGRMSKEDEALHRLAGKQWEDWAEKVPYRLVPLIY